MNQEFASRLLAKIAEATQAEVNMLAAGGLEYPDYKRVCGRIKAFSDVAEWCEEIKADIDQGK